MALLESGVSIKNVSVLLGHSSVRITERHYRKTNDHYCCVVVKHLNGDGFVVTAYLTDTIKAGEAIT